MATRAMIKSMLDGFANMYPREINERLINDYMRALKKFGDKEVSTAGYTCMEECTFFPRPHDIISRIPLREENENSKFWKDRYTCQVCHHLVSAISEGKCLDCAIISPGYYNDLKQPELKSTKPFHMHGRMKCQTCGTIGFCIKDPIDIGTWECRDCYSGMNIFQRKQKFQTLIDKLKTIQL